MALKKDITKFGYNFEYSMISAVSFIKESDKTYITVNIYKDKSTRDADITNHSDIINFETVGNKSVAECYEFLKTTEQYQDAEDC